MTREEIIKAVNTVFVEQFELDIADLTPDKRFFDDLGLDSLDIVDLMIGLQRKFGVSLRQNEEIRKIVTMGDIYEFFVKLDSEKNK